MTQNPIPVRFFKTEGGNEPVREWLKLLGRPGSTVVGEHVGTVQRGWPVGMPVCRAMGGGLYEVRCSLHDDRIARVLFFFHDSEMILLHAFIKKTRKTPETDLKLARDRQAQYKAASD